VYYVIIDTSDGNLSQSSGREHRGQARQLRPAFRCTESHGRKRHHRFSGDRRFFTRAPLERAWPFPPATFRPGARGEAGYSPLAQLPNGTVLNAPQIARDANGDGRIDLFTEAADKVVSIDIVGMKVTYRETQGVQGGKAVNTLLSTRRTNWRPRSKT